MLNNSDRIRTKILLSKQLLSLSPIQFHNYLYTNIQIYIIDDTFSYILISSNLVFPHFARVSLSLSISLSLSSSGLD